MRPHTGTDRAQLYHSTPVTQRTSRIPTLKTWSISGVRAEAGTATDSALTRQTTLTLRRRKKRENASLLDWTTTPT